MRPNQLSVKKVVIGGLLFTLVIIIVVLVQIFVLATTLHVSVSQGTGDQNTEVTVRSAKTNVEVASSPVGPGGTRFRLAPGTYTVSLRSKDAETLGFAKLKRFERGRISLTVHKEKTVQKVGSGSLGCDEIVRSQLFSYACTKPSAVVRHDNPPDRFVFPAPLNNGAEQQINTQAYLEGLLAMFDNHDTRYFDYLQLANNQRMRLNVPENSPENYTIITDSTDSSNPRFILFDPEFKRVYAYDNLQDTRPVKIELPKEIPEEASISYSLNGSSFTLYAGLPDYASDTKEEEEAHQQIKQSYLYALDLGQRSASFQKFKLPEEFRANDVAPLAKNRYLVQKMASFEIYDRSVNGFEIIYAVHSAGGISRHKDGSMLFTKDGGLFRYDPGLNQSYRLFSSSRVHVSRTGYSKEGQPMFNGFIEGDNRRTLHSFLVTGTEVSGRRWEGFLPYTAGSSLPIVRMDYVGSSIKVQLSLQSFISDRQTGKTTYDPTEFAKARKAVLDQLSKDGINTATTSVNFTQ